MKLDFEVFENKANLPAQECLANLPENVQLYHGDHQSRPPLGIYNVSVHQCVSSFTRVLDLLLDEESAGKSFYTKDNSAWEFEILQRYDGLLDALMEHMEDCLNVLLCFFPDKKSRKSDLIIKAYEKNVGFYRDHIGRVDNHIKHNQGRLRVVGMRNDAHFVLGYFVEGVDENGVLVPYKPIHGEKNSAFSFNRDLRFHLAHLFFVSSHLETALESLLPSVPRRCTADGSGEMYSLIQKIANLPRQVFPNEVNLDWPKLSVVPKNGKTNVTVEFPSISQRCIALRGKCQTFAKTQGDGVSRSFRVPFLPN